MHTSPEAHSSSPYFARSTGQVREASSPHSSVKSPHTATLCKPHLGRCESPPDCTSPRQSGTGGKRSPQSMCGGMPKLHGWGKFRLEHLRRLAIGFCAVGGGCSVRRWCVGSVGRFGCRSLCRCRRSLSFRRSVCRSVHL